MNDLVFGLLIAGFFVLMAGFIQLCQRLMEG